MKTFYALFMGALLAAGVAQAADSEPATGLPFKARRGWFAEAQLGVFTAFGGEKSVSNGQPFVAVSAGTDLEAVPGLQLFFTVGHGSNQGSCRSVDLSKPNGCAVGAPQAFSIIPLELGARYRFNDLVPRLRAFATLTAGYSLMLPAPIDGAALGSPHAGLGGGVEYATRLDGLTVGAEVLVRSTFSPLIPFLTAYPRVQYVF
jgi:hypothetical protein